MATQAAPAIFSKRIRKVFGNIHEVVAMPNLIEVQRESYEQFLRSDASIGYVSRSATSLAPPSLISSTMSSKIRNSIPRNVGSAGSLTRPPCASRCG
jgi:DNA-directed RNA polymerase beta subunit